MKIRKRRVKHWNQVTYAEFRAKHSTEDEASRKCIYHITAHHKNHPMYMFSDAILLDLLRSIFKHVPWCGTVYKRISSGHTSSAFTQATTTAAWNAYDCKHSENPQTTRAYNLTSGSSHELISTYQHLVPFFSKTPPPPNY